MYDFTLTGFFNNDIDTVFAAFHKPDVIHKWFAPGNLTVLKFAANFVEGGRYRAIMQSPDGFQQTVVGSYQRIQHNSEISFTWRWDDTNDVSKVRISFASTPNLGTKISLTQSGFKREQDLRNQQHAWMASLEKLSLTMNETQLTNRKLVA